MTKTTVFEVTKPLWIVSRLLGLYSNEIEQNFNGKLTTTGDSNNKLWHVYTFLLLSTFSYFAYWSQYIESQLEVNKIVELTDELTSISNTTVFVVTISYNFARRNTFKTILYEFHNIEADLEKNLHLETIHRTTSLIVNWGMIVVGAFTAISCLVLLFVVPYDDWFIATKGWLLYYVFMGITDIHVLQFIMLVFLLRGYLKKLKEEVGKLIKEGDVLRALKYEQSKIAHDDEVQAMLRVKKCSRNLYEVSLKINSIFSVPLFFSLADSFISLFSGMYFSLYGFIYTNHIFIPSQLKDCLPTLVLLSRHFVKLLLVTVLCENTYSIRKSMAWMLHGIQSDEKNRMLREQVIEFSMQLIHEKISFSASGFFNINSNVLQMVISSVTIYLVILIQFDMAAN